MGRKRKQAADYAADQPDSLEVVKKTGETTECLHYKWCAVEIESRAHRIKNTLKANDTSFKGGGRT